MTVRYVKNLNESFAEIELKCLNRKRNWGETLNMGTTL